MGRRKSIGLGRVDHDPTAHDAVYNLYTETLMGAVAVELDQDLVAILEELQRPVKQAARCRATALPARWTARPDDRVRARSTRWSASNLFGMPLRGAFRTSSFEARSCGRRSKRARTSKCPSSPNSSPLIALVAIDRLPLLPALFESVFIPPAVAFEVRSVLPALPGWLRLQNLTHATL